MSRVLFPASTNTLRHRPLPHPASRRHPPRTNGSRSPARPRPCSLRLRPWSARPPPRTGKATSSPLFFPPLGPANRRPSCRLARPEAPLLHASPRHIRLLAPSDPSVAPVRPGYAAEAWAPVCGGRACAGIVWPLWRARSFPGPPRSVAACFSFLLLLLPERASAPPPAPCSPHSPKPLWRASRCFAFFLPRLQSPRRSRAAQGIRHSHFF